MHGLGRRAPTDTAAQRHAPGAFIEDSSHHAVGGDRPYSEEHSPRFPITRQGYDRAIVDQRFAELEQEVIELDRELTRLQGPTAPRNDAAAEIDRIGKQVSAILIAAHESADATKRLAEAEAERRIADAESRVRRITEGATGERERLQDEIASLRRDRELLLDDIRSIADGLRALADKPREDSSAEPVEPVDEHAPVAEP